MMDYIYRKEALTKNPLTQLALVHDDIPVFYVMMKRADVPKMIAHTASLLKRYDKQLEQQVSRFQSASALRKQFVDTEKMLMRLETSYAQYEAAATVDNALALYDDVLNHLEFAAKHMPYVYDANAWKLHKHGVKEDSIRALFEELYELSVNVYPANITADELGFYDEYITFYMMKTDIMYDFPTMLKTGDLPNFTLNIAKYFKKDPSRGKTKSAVVDHAFTRMIQSLALEPLKNSPLLMRPNPAYRVELSDVQLPIVTERKRYVVQKLIHVEALPHQAMHYEDGRFTRSMNAVEAPATVITEKLLEKPFIVKQFNDVNSARDDRAHLPVSLQIIDDIDAFIAQVTDELSATEQAFYTILTSHFKEEVSKLCKQS